MANHQHVDAKLRVAAPADSAVDGRELEISWVRNLYARFVGTRAQLEDEGFIPPALLWPEKDMSVYWQMEN